MKSALILGLAGLAAALPVAQDETITRTFDNPFPSVEIPTDLPTIVLPPPFKRDDPVTTRSVGLGDPWGPLPTGIVIPPIFPPKEKRNDPVVTRSFVLPPGPFGKRNDPVVTRSFVLPPGPFGKRNDPVVTRSFVLPPGPFGKREAEAGDPVVTRSFSLGNPWGKRDTVPATSDYGTTRSIPTESDYGTTRTVPEPSDAGTTRTVGLPSDYGTTRSIPAPTEGASTRYPTPGGPDVTRTFTLPPLPTVNPINLSPPLEKRDALYPDYLQVVGITYGGTGCPATPVNCSVGDYGRQLGFAAEHFTATVGPKVAVTEQRKNCQFNINLKYPAGWSYAITAIDYTGYGYLEKGVSGVVKATEYFSGQTAQVGVA